MQQNVLRWFYEAYVNRLGAHVIELLSGRLAIGAEQYRKLTRPMHSLSQGSVAELGPLKITVAGAQGAGKSRLIAKLREACGSDPTLLKARLCSSSVAPSLVDRLREAEWIEAPGYTLWTGAESRRDRSRRNAAVEASISGDLLILVVDARQRSNSADAAFAHDWVRWWVEQPRREMPPALVVLTGVDRPELGNGWHPPYDWLTGQGARESAVRSRLDTLRAILPPPFADLVAVGLSDDPPFGLFEHVLPAIAAQLLRAERSALLRRLHELGGRSKMGRLAQQLRQQGRALIDSIKARAHTQTGSS
jgi:predicted GTPase